MNEPKESGNDRYPEAVDAAIEALNAVTMIQSPAVAQHIRATARLVSRTARELQLDNESTFRAEAASRVHDIGLNGILLSDSDRAITEQEHVILQLHAERGEAILNSIFCLRHLAPIVRSHHERIDGTGYPDHLFGDEIPIESRIIAVADAFHFMTTPKRWREQMSPVAALQELRRCSGTQFDGDVVAALFGSLSVLPERVFETG
jgi:HD-GYP domain-containing protein (c-di-GMP phosphodiesterase class II)